MATERKKKPNKMSPTKNDIKCANAFRPKLYAFYKFKRILCSLATEFRLVFRLMTKCHQKFFEKISEISEGI